MSVPDAFLDEPDYEICEEHDRWKPCCVCSLEYIESRADAKREEGGHSND